MFKYLLLAFVIACLCAGAPILLDAIRFQALMFRQPGSYCPAVWPFWRGEDAG